MKLVKPPEKKPEPKKTETVPTPAVKVAKRPANKVDIMDLDLINFGSSPQPATI